MSKETFWHLIVVVLLVTSIWSYRCNAADLPEYTDLTFNNQADLDAQVDSVLAVCDTVDRSRWEPCYLGADSIRVRGNNVIAFFEFDSLLVRGDENDSCYIQIWPATILCRRWAGLTIMWMPNETRPGLYYYGCPETGKARLWWWEEE